MPPVIVRASAEPLERHRFPGWQEAAFGWTHASPNRDPVVRLEGVGAEEAGCSWTVATGEKDPVSVALESQYRHTVFQPGDHFDVAVQETEVSAWRVWVALAGIVALLGLLTLHPWPLKVTLDSGEVVRACGAIRIDREVDRPELKLTIRRTLFGCLRLTRHDRSAHRVYVAAPGLARREAAARSSLRVAAGDRIEIESIEGSSAPTCLTVGGWATAAPDVDALDELGETKSSWLVR